MYPNIIQLIVLVNYLRVHLISVLGQGPTVNVESGAHLSLASPWLSVLFLAENATLGHYYHG
jgi:hypothetical protein